MSTQPFTQQLLKAVKICNKDKPFFFEQVEEKSFSSILTEGRLHFIRQKKERLAPEHSLDGPGVMSVFTGRPAGRERERERASSHYS